ncbi:MAG TPA: tRNA epoxyqueuosine(34) reductase QueG, partial [Acidimicrobiales bacterium]|nr:tRNA epoxyqueuosine(34) reductase QueG [Acidimicrobiales bacterium]
GGVTALARRLERGGLRAGLDAVGIAPAEPFEDTREVLEARRAAGLHGGMQFTYRNPRRSTDPGATLPGARALVVGARSYLRRPPKPTDPGPDAPTATDRTDRTEHTAGGTVARYSWVDHYEPLRRALGHLAGQLTGAGWRATVVADDNALVDREAAYRAGLGWYGKNANLLLGERGSWFVLGAVLTDAPLPPTGPPMDDGCGACTACLPACPTGALVAPGVLDARRCLAWLLEAPGPFPPEHRAALGGRVYGCDDCQEACPVNRRHARHRPPPAPEPEAEPAVDLVEMLEADDVALMARFGRWYVPGREARYLRRNALVALGNVGDPADPGVERALRAALHHRDPLVRGHAVWAAARLGRPDLLDGLGRRESDPGVLAELGAASRPASTGR